MNCSFVFHTAAEFLTAAVVQAGRRLAGGEYTATELLDGHPAYGGLDGLRGRLQDMLTSFTSSDILASYMADAYDL